jgi:glycosyltransferase involved in cell wall biosynthesis
MKDDYRILQIIDSLQVGGSERMSVNICNSLTSHNIQNRLVVSRKSGPIYNFISEKKSVFFLNKKGGLDFFAFIRLFNLIREYKPRVIHAHQTSIYWVFVMKLLFPNVIVIWHDHWGLSDLLKSSDRKGVKYFSFLIDGVICVNDKIKVWNTENLKVKGESIVYIPNFPLFKNAKRKEVRSTTLLCIANIREQKDHANLLNACFLLKEQNVDFNLLLAGSLEDINWVEKIKKLIIELNLNDSVALLGPVNDISELLSNADVGILSSVSEGLPVSLLEYGLAELPVVCTDVGQCKEVLGNGEYGWLVPVKSPVELADAIKEALEDSELAILRAGRLKKNILENYSSKGFIKKYMELINSINK